MALFFCSLPGFAGDFFFKSLDNLTEACFVGSFLTFSVLASATFFSFLDLLALFDLAETLSDDFVVYQKQVVANAKALAAHLSENGLKIVSGGTDTHVFLVDLTAKDITGKQAEEALDLAGITVNKNTVPFETRSPFVTSGIRIGTPALTTRGMKEAEMERIAGFIKRVLRNADNETVIAQVREEVLALTAGFPIP